MSTRLERRLRRQENRTRLIEHRLRREQVKRRRNNL